MMNITVREDATITDVFKQLNSTSEKTLLIVDSQNRLLGTLTDGDIRRSLLSGGLLDSKIKGIYNKSPKFLVKDNYSEEQAKAVLISNKIELLPVVNGEGVLVDYITWEQHASEQNS